MNTNMNELSINEMELVNAGLCGIAIAACVVGVVSAAIKVADFVYDTVKGKQQTPALSSQAASAVFSFAPEPM